MYQKYTKPILDFVFSLVLLLGLSPIILVISILVYFKLGKPIIFKQRRPGLDDEIFILYKFRTMKDEKDLSGNILPDKDRITKFGKLLRSSSLDELPSLVNILKGEMSFIGPRPLLEEYLPLYNGEQSKRHLVKPGLTGLAQVSGRNSLKWKEKFALDFTYVNQVSFIKDCRILFKTFLTVFKKEGITSNDSVSMEKFSGNE